MLHNSTLSGLAISSEKTLFVFVLTKVFFYVEKLLFEVNFNLFFLIETNRRNFIKEKLFTLPKRVSEYLFI
ncbi:hypothetical protein ASC72_15680 [Flavobacterium sp. Root420]|nr:hypothetical protein ASC72_15680 [Flavobacterium sp. Root420]